MMLQSLRLISGLDQDQESVAGYGQQHSWVPSEHSDALPYAYRYKTAYVQL